MISELYLLRHAKSDWNAGAPTDFDRPLASRGRKACKRMGRFIRDAGIVPDRVLSSPAVRTRETVESVGKIAGWDPGRIVWQRDLYLADLGTLLEHVADCGRETRSMLIVGHNPGLEELVEYLSPGEVEAGPGGKLFPTAALACFTFDGAAGSPEAGSARNVRIVRPRELEG